MKNNLNKTPQPLIYFAHAMDGKNEKDIINLSKEVKDELSLYNLLMVDTFTLNSKKNGQNNDGSKAKSIVEGDLRLLRKSDAVLMDMSIPNRNYIGCSCELVYARLWMIPIIAYVGKSGNEKRYWLQYHAASIFKKRKEAIKYLIKITTKL